MLHVCLCDAAAVLSFFPFVHVMSVVSGFDDLVQSGADPFFFSGFTPRRSDCTCFVALVAAFTC